MENSLQEGWSEKDETYIVLEATLRNPEGFYQEGICAREGGKGKRE